MTILDSDSPPELNVLPRLDIPQEKLIVEQVLSTHQGIQMGFLPQLDLSQLGLESRVEDAKKSNLP